MTSDDVMTCFFFNPLVFNTFRLNSLRSFLCVIQYSIQYFASARLHSILLPAVLLYSVLLYSDFYIHFCAFCPTAFSAIIVFSFGLSSKVAFESCRLTTKNSPHEMVFS